MNVMLECDMKSLGHVLLLANASNSLCTATHDTRTRGVAKCLQGNQSSH